MNDELRAAAERVRKRSGTSGEVCYSFCGHDVCDLARAYLAEHPADDGEPVSEEWLRGMGCRPVDSIAGQWPIATLPPRFEVYWFPKDRTLRLHTNNLDADGMTTSPGGCHVVTLSPTRGHVRRLAAALGIPLADAPA